MPDDLATRATLMLTVGILACLGIGALVSLVWRKATGLASGATAGGALGLALFTAGMLWTVGDMAAVAWQVRNLERVDGVLVEFERVVVDTRRGRTQSTRAPVVEFRTADGRTHHVRGLGGSQAELQPGDKVPVHVDPIDPARSIVADFQNQYAAVMLFAIIGGVTLLGAIYQIIATVTELRDHLAARRQPGQHNVRRRPQRQLSAFERWRDGPRGAARHRTIKRLAITTFALSVAGLFVVAEFMHLVQAFGATFAGVAASMLWAGIAALVEPGKGGPMALFGWLIGTFGMGGFGAMLWMLAR